MFSEILKFIPKLDTGELNKMEKNLQSRFTRVAKRFGQGIGNIFKGGGFVGVALGLLNKLLNPLQEIQESMDRTLKNADDLATNAQQFGTTPGQLAKLKALGEATGLQDNDLYMMINKFQNAVAQASSDTNKPSAVRNFVNQPDTAEGFFQFIQSLQKMDKNQQLLVQQEVFGEKQVLKMADFLQQDFPKLMQEVLAGVSTADLNKNIGNVAGLADLSDKLGARRNIQDIGTKGSLINDSMIRERDKAARVALQKENKRLQSYDNLQAIDNTMTNIMTMLEQAFAQIGGFINMVTPKINELLGYIQGFSKSSIFKGIFKFGKGD